MESKMQGSVGAENKGTIFPRFIFRNKNSGLFLVVRGIVTDNTDLTR